MTANLEPVLDDAAISEVGAEQAAAAFAQMADMFPSLLEGLSEALSEALDRMAAVVETLPALPASLSG